MLLAVAAGGLLLAGLGWLGPGAPPKLLYVAVPPTELSGELDDEGERRLEASAVEAGIFRAMLDLQGLAAVELGPGDTDLHDPPSLAKALAADEVVTSELECSTRTCQVVLRRLDGRDGRVLGDGRLTFAAGEESLLGISLNVADQVRFVFDELERRRGVKAPKVSAEDYERFLELEERYLVRGSNRESQPLDLHRELEAIRRSSPEFVSVHRFAASYWMLRFQETRQAADLVKAKEALEAARRIAPDDPRIAMAAFEIHLVAGELERAREHLGFLAAREPGDVDVLVMRSRLLVAEGRHSQALELLEEAISRRPAWNFFAHLAVLHREMGQLQKARAAAAGLLERAPENYFGQSMAAELEILTGNIDRAVELYEEVVERRREPTELSNLGTAYLLQGRFELAAEVYRELVAMVPDSAPALLNLADVELLVNAPGAEARYRRVIELASSSPDPEALLLVKAQALAHLGEREAAVQATLEALRLSPEDPKVAFEAALVYAVVGESTSAQLHARRALESGMSPVWFGMPWFEGILEDLPPVH